MNRLDLDSLTLSAGGHHKTGDDRMCFMEAVAVYNDLPKSDSPQDVSLALRDFGVALNDALPDEWRQKLISFIPRVFYTGYDGKERARRLILLDVYVRLVIPVLSRRLGVVVAGIRPVVDTQSWIEVHAALQDPKLHGILPLLFSEKYRDLDLTLSSAQANFVPFLFRDIAKDLSDEERQFALDAYERMIDPRA